MYFFENKQKKKFGIWHIKCIFIALHQAFCQKKGKKKTLVKTTSSDWYIYEGVLISP